MRKDHDTLIEKVYEFKRKESLGLPVKEVLKMLGKMGFKIFQYPDYGAEKIVFLRMY